MSWYIDIEEGKLEGEISWDLELGWERYIGLEGRFVGMHSFGASGKIADVYKKFDINAEAVVRAARRWRRLSPMTSKILTSGGRGRQRRPLPGP